MSDLKENQRVTAHTVHTSTPEPGKITEIRKGQKGAWYSVKLDDGRTINTRAVCIKPV